jgi:N-acetyl-anhydromuramyl-L-alanine amidase AmpD
MPKQCPKISTYGILFLFFVLSACTSPRGIESANYNSRVSIVVIHHTTANFGDSLRILTEPSSNPVSSHYLIPEPDDNTYEQSRMQTYELVPESQRAWHAGTSSWAGKSGLNDQSIGIELVNQTWCHSSGMEVDPRMGNPDRICFYPDFADSQIALLVDLLDDILERHPDVRPTNIIGHADIAPDRKIDPGPRFPWQRLAVLGYGAWFDDETVIRYWEQFRVQPLPLSNVQKALSAYGYGVEVSGENDEQTRNVLRAFQMHFRPMGVTSTPSLETTATLFALIEKYHPEQLDELLQIEPQMIEPEQFGPEQEEPDQSDPTPETDDAETSPAEI